MKPEVIMARDGSAYIRLTTGARAWSHVYRMDHDENGILIGIAVARGNAAIHLPYLIRQHIVTMWGAPMAEEAAAQYVAGRLHWWKPYGN